MFAVILSPDAEKNLGKLAKSDRKLFRQVATALDMLAENPNLGKALVENLKGYYSHRVRDYRIVYDIQRESEQVVVLKIQHRKEVYR